MGAWVGIGVPSVFVGVGEGMAPFFVGVGVEVASFFVRMGMVVGVGVGSLLEGGGHGWEQGWLHCSTVEMAVGLAGGLASHASMETVRCIP